MTIAQTERLLLRVFNADDAEFALQLTNEPGWLRFIGDRHIRSRKDAASWIQNGPLIQQQQSGYSFYVVCLRDTGQAVGICGLIKRPQLEDTDLGYAFLQDFHRRGYAHEAAGAVIRLAREQLALKQLAAITLPDNLASNSLLEKLGFSQNGQVRLTADGPDNLLWRKAL